MKASKAYGPCACGCGYVIQRGEEIYMLSGEMYLVGHETRELELNTNRDWTKYRDQEIAQKGVSGLPLFDPEPEQIRLF